MFGERLFGVQTSRSTLLTVELDNAESERSCITGTVQVHHEIGHLPPFMLLSLSASKVDPFTCVLVNKCGGGGGGVGSFRTKQKKSVLQINQNAILTHSNAPNSIHPKPNLDLKFANAILDWLKPVIHLALCLFPFLFMFSRKKHRY